MAKTELPHHHGEEKMNTAEIREVLERVDNFQTIADVFRQLGDTTRVRIFWLLCHCDECVVNIAVMLDMSSPAVSHHLRTLRQRPDCQPPRGQGSVLSRGGQRAEPPAA